MNDRERWDAKFLAQDPKEAGSPDPFFRKAMAALPDQATGHALDLACGLGRHALQLAREGWQVQAWDISPIGLRFLDNFARREKLSIQSKEVNLFHQNSYPLIQPFDLVVLMNFLDRTFMDTLKTLSRPNGYIIFSTFTTERPGTKPPTRYCLRPRELEEGLPGYDTLLYEEENGRAGLLAQRKPSP